VDEGVRVSMKTMHTVVAVLTDRVRPGRAPDKFINQAYADPAAAQGPARVFLGRIGAAEQGGIHSSYPLGPWSERRNTLQFTGDTPMSWDMLAYEADFTPDEAAAGLSNVSHRRHLLAPRGLRRGHRSVVHHPRPGDLAGIAGPVWLLTSTESPVPPADRESALRGVLPGLERVTLPGQGHFAYLSAPAVLARAVTACLSEGRA
jgi:pimeloyl-ACP methyl ester carboxylesterase